MRLSERTILTCLHVRSWGGNAIDQDVTEEVSESHKADIKGAGRYTKKLVAPKFLRDVNSKINVTRATHRLLTLPWDDSARILSTMSYTHYTEQMRLHRLGFEAAVNAFIGNFDACVDEARVRLGTMFDKDEYPSMEDVHKRYGVEVEIKPVPEAGDFRAELSNESTKNIVKDIERRTEQRLEAAMNDVFQRITEATAKMVERLRAYKPVEGGRAENGFRDSLVYNLKELAELIPALNITNDKRLDDLQRRILDDLVAHSPEILRDNDRLREQTAAKAEAILRKAEKFMK